MKTCSVVLALCLGLVAAQTTISVNDYTPPMGTGSPFTNINNAQYTFVLSEAAAVEVYVIPQPGCMLSSVLVQLGSVPTAMMHDDISLFPAIDLTGPVSSLNAYATHTVSQPGTYYIVVSGMAGQCDSGYTFYTAITTWAAARTKCLYSDVLTSVTGYNAVINQLQNASFSDMATILGTQLETVLGSLTYCITLAMTGITMTSKTEHYPQTTQCLRDPTDSMYQTDPCCNAGIASAQCCVARDVDTVNPHYIVGVNSAEIAQCNTPDKSSGVVEFFADFYNNGLKICQGLTQSALGLDSDIDFNAISQCYTEIQATNPCNSDFDCYSGVCGNFGISGQRQCYVDYSIDQSGPLLDCVFDKLDDVTLQYVRNAVGALTDTLDQLRVKFKAYVLSASGTCVGPLSYSQTTYMPILDQPTCVAVQNCNWNQYALYNSVTNDCVSGLTTDFCGLCVGSGPNAHCQEIYGITQQVDCTGYCPYNPSLTTSATCPSIQSCNWPCNGTLCANQNDCQTNGGYCSGNGINDLPACIRALGPQDVMSTYASCSGGDLPSYLGCKSTTATTSGGCAALALSDSAAGWRWIDYPTNVEECNAIMLCSEPSLYQPSGRQGAACTGCGGTPVPAFKWVGGQWISQSWVPYTWQARAPHQANVWANQVDYNKFYSLVSGVQDKRMLTYFINALNCIMGPLTAVLEALSCDCGTGGTGDCFANNLIFPVGSADCFETTGCTSNGAGGTMQAAPSSAPSGSSQVTVYMSPSSNFQSGASSTQSVGFKTQSVSGSVYFGGSVVGIILGNGLGYRFSSPARGPVQICLAVDLSIDSSSYSTYDFGTLCDDGKVHASQTTATFSAGQVCGSVSANGNYYPVKRNSVSGSDTCNPVQPGANTPASGGQTSDAYITHTATTALFMLIFVLTVAFA